MKARVNTKTVLQDIGKQLQKNRLRKNQYIQHLIDKIDYPLEIFPDGFTFEEFKKLRKLSHHIREYQYFNCYILLDNAISHHFGSIYWTDVQWQIESILYNLNRLLHEKGSEPTEDDLKSYVENHSLDLKWHPEAVWITFQNIQKERRG